MMSSHFSFLKFCKIVPVLIVLAMSIDDIVNCIDNIELTNLLVIGKSKNLDQSKV